MGNTLSQQSPSDEVEREPTGVVANDEQVMMHSWEAPVGTPDYEINQYLLARVPVFHELTRLRKEGWKNPAGDEYFARQRCQTDSTSNKHAKFFFKMMQIIGKEIHGCTRVFRIITPDGRPPKILDMCMAPGAFLELAMQRNPKAQARAFSLPAQSGGHRVRIKSDPNINITYLDITMLAADMGVESIPQAHPDANNFLPRELDADDVFDLAICDGQVLRAHTRAPYRESREAARLTLTQLALSLEHIRPGGTILILLHRIESWKSVIILYIFSKFSMLRVYKPKTSHRKRSSCYLVASRIQSEHEDAVRTVGILKQLWKSATFDTEEEYRQLARSLAPDVKEVLENFGPELVRLGRQGWQTQAKALAETTWN